MFITLKNEILKKIDLFQDKKGLVTEGLNRLVRFFDLVPVMISFTNQKLEYEFVNKAYEDFFCLSREQIIGRKLIDIIGGEVYEKASDYIERVLSGEEIKYVEKFEYSHENQRFIEGHLIPEFDGSGSVSGYWAILRDITEIKELEYVEAKLMHETIFAGYQLNLVNMIENELNQILQENNYENEEFKTLYKLLSDEKHIRSNQAVFDNKYEDIIPVLFSRLQQNQIKLTQHDLKHIAMIKLKMDTKDIARIFNVKPSSIQMARVRLKRKLGLNRKDDLIDFIRQL